MLAAQTDADKANTPRKQHKDMLEHGGVIDEIFLNTSYY